MNKLITMNKKSLLIILIALVVTALLSHFLTKLTLGSGPNENAGESKPLYWVAPMDPNYRRDQPGKSPMGMDLVPVYAENNAAADSPGSIFISPDVVNNLGVRTAKAELRLIRSEITTVGYVQYDEDRLIHVHPRVDGWIEKLHVKAAGDPVEKGQPLYTLYSPQLVNAQEELLLAVNRDNTRLLDAAENRLRSLQIDQATINQLKLDRKVQQTMTFYTPQTGVIDNLNIREGFFVQPGTTLMSVGTLDSIWVEAEVFERQAALVKPGLPVYMKLDYLPGREWHGEVDYVYPSLDDQTRTLAVRLKFENPDGLLKPNMYAQIRIDSRNQDPVLSVPSDAVIRTGDQDRVVLALGDGYYKSIAVELGQISRDYTEILSGLTEGESVVTSAQFLLDSESSKTSDFKRLHHGDSRQKEIDNLPSSDQDSLSIDQANLVWVAAEIKAVMPKMRMVSAYHEPIPDWQWPEMTMNFFVTETVNFDDLRPGTELHMQIGARDDGQYEIHSVHIMSQPDDDQSGQDDMSEGMDHSHHVMHDH